MTRAGGKVVLGTRRALLAGLAGAACHLALPLRAEAWAPLTLALQEGGTAAWEIAAMQAAGLDRQHQVELAIRPVADSRAGQVALQAGAVDVILSDFVWVSTQRHQGADLALVPHSLAVGGLLAAPGGTVRQVADLEGRVLAVAGGPADKSYLFLQAYFTALTGKRLPEVAEVDFGAPPLVNELLAGGQADAALNFWHFAVRARLGGASQIISVQEMLAELGVSRPPPLLGWTFSQGFAAARPQALRRFLDASFATKALLMRDAAIWQTIRPQMRGAEDEALFVALRDGYRQGIVISFGPADIQAAGEAFALIAAQGGSEVTGGATDLAPGTFWPGYSL